MNPPTESRRIRLLGVDGPPRARVRLQRDEQTVEAEVPDGPDSLEAVARATLAAVAQLLPSSVTLELDELHVVGNARLTVVVLLTLTVTGVPLAHTGSALVGDDPRLASAKAALAAINRRLEIIGA